MYSWALCNEARMSLNELYILLTDDLAFIWFNRYGVYWYYVSLLLSIVCMMHSG